MTMKIKKELGLKTHLKILFYITSKEGERYPFFASMLLMFHHNCFLLLIHHV